MPTYNSLTTSNHADRNISHYATTTTLVPRTCQGALATRNCKHIWPSDLLSTFILAERMCHMCTAVRLACTPHSSVCAETVYMRTGQQLLVVLNQSLPMTSANFEGLHAAQPPSPCRSCPPSRQGLSLLMPGVSSLSFSWPWCCCAFSCISSPFLSTCSAASWTLPPAASQPAATAADASMQQQMRQCAGGLLAEHDLDQPCCMTLRLHHYAATHRGLVSLCQFRRHACVQTPQDSRPFPMRDPSKTGYCVVLAAACAALVLRMHSHCGHTKQCQQITHSSLSPCMAEPPPYTRATLHQICITASMQCMSPSPASHNTLTDGSLCCKLLAHCTLLVKWTTNLLGGAACKGQETHNTHMQQQAQVHGVVFCRGHAHTHSVTHAGLSESLARSLVHVLCSRLLCNGRGGHCCRLVEDAAAAAAAAAHPQQKL